MYIVLPFIPVFFLILLFVMLTCNSSSGDASGVAGVFFAVPFANDVDYEITSEFGNRIDPLTHQFSYHSGIDVAAPVGTFILASANGVVESLGFDESLGNFVSIKHDFDGLVYYSVYAHMLDESIMVKKGDVIIKGQPIGIIGATGRVTGVHLHFTLMQSVYSFEPKYLVDPILVFQGKL